MTARLCIPVCLTVHAQVSILPPPRTAKLLLLPLLLCLGSEILLFFVTDKQVLFYLLPLYLFLDHCCFIFLFLKLKDPAKKSGHSTSDFFKLLHIRRQLDASTANPMYLQLCRQNHDLENHLFSLNWLLRQHQYQRALLYLKTLEHEKSV